MQPPGGGQEAGSGLLGVEPRLHRPAVETQLLLRQRQRLAGRDAQLPLDQVLPGDRFRHRMLHLQPRVHLHEPDAVGAQPVAPVCDELDRAGAAVSHRPRRPDRGGAHRLAHGGLQPGRRSLLDHLLVPALQRAVALEQVHDVAVVVGEHLHLDVARPGHPGFQQHPVVAERRLRLATAGSERGRELVRPVDPAHPLAAAAGDRLDQHRIADPRGLRRQPFPGLVVTQVARRDRHARLGHQRLGGVLEPHGTDRRRRRPDPDQPGRDHRLGEPGILGQEAVARMDRRRPRATGGLQDALRHQVAFARRRRADRHRLVRLGHERRLRVRIREHGDAAYAEPPAGADDPPGDLAAIGDEQGRDHVRPTSGTGRSAATPRSARSATPRSPGPARRASAPDR